MRREAARFQCGSAAPFVDANSATHSGGRSSHRRPQSGMPPKSSSAQVERAPRRSTRTASKPQPAYASSVRKRRADAGADKGSSKKKVDFFFSLSPYQSRDISVIKTMSSQAKSDVEGNAAQSPDGAGEAPEVEVEAKIDSIDIGDSLPSVSLKNEKGEEVDVAQLAAEKGVVMFLVPKADTRRCSVVEKRTILTHTASQRAARRRRVVSEIAFRITRLLASMCTVSARTHPLRKASGRGRYYIYANIEAHAVYLPSTPLQRNLPYSLLSDPKRVLIGALGAADGNKTKRSHFIFEKGGKLVDRKLPVKPADRSVWFSRRQPPFYRCTFTLTAQDWPWSSSRRWGRRRDETNAHPVIRFYAYRTLAAVLSYAVLV